MIISKFIILFFLLTPSLFALTGAEKEILTYEPYNYKTDGKSYDNYSAQAAAFGFLSGMIQSGIALFVERKLNNNRWPTNLKKRLGLALAYSYLNTQIANFWSIITWQIGSGETSQFKPYPYSDSGSNPVRNTVNFLLTTALTGSIFAYTFYQKYFFQFQRFRNAARGTSRNRSDSESAIELIVDTSI